MSKRSIDQIVFPNEIPILKNSLITLRENKEADISFWFSRATDVESADLAGDLVPTSIDQGLIWLKRQQENFKNKAAIRWAIDSNKTQLNVGSIGLTIVSNEQRIADLGIVIARSCWGQGYGTFAIELVKNFAFHELLLTKIQAEVLARNSASKQLLIKCGFAITNDKVGPIEKSDEPMLCFELCSG